MRRFYVKLSILMLFWLVMQPIIQAETHSETLKLQVHDLKISGNAFFNQEILKQMMISRPGWLWHKRIYQPDLLQADMQNLIRFYHQHGFLEAAVTSYQVIPDSAAHRVSIQLVLDEGERTVIEGLNLFGNRIFPDSVLSVKLKINAGQPLLAKEIDQGQISLLHFYAEQGYLDAQVTADVKTNPESHRALVDFHIEENRISRLRRITLTGIKKTRPVVLLRELTVDSGAVIRYSQLLESQRKLYLTGLFHYAYVKPMPRDSLSGDLRDLVIEVQEHEYGEFNLSAGYGSEDKLRTRLEVVHKNILGSARKLGFQTWLSFIQRGVMASATDPWLFQKPVKADLNIVIESKNEPSYDIFKSGGQSVFGRKIGRSTDIRLTFRQDFSRYTHVKILPDDKAKANIRSMKWSLTVDTRNNLFDTRSGYFYQGSYELARASFETKVLFHRWESEFKAFLDGGWCVFGTGLEAGWLINTGTIDVIPLNERYYAGGQGSVRGFAYNKLGPLNAEGLPTGGALRLVWRVGEIRFPMFRSLGAAVFSDAGNCWTSAGNVKITNLRYSAGIGVRLHTFLGIIRADYAWKIDRRPGEKTGQFVFSMGHAF